MRTKAINSKAKKLSALLVASLLFIGCQGESGSNGGGGESGSVTAVSIDYATLNLGVNDTAQLTATVKGSSDLTEIGVNWSSSRSDVASVSSTGLVTALAAGTARITAVSKADTSKSAYCDVTVESNTAASSTKTEYTVGTSPVAIDFTYSGNGATIYFYSQSGGLNFYGIKAGTNTWNPATFGVQTYSATTQLTSNDVTFTAVLSGSDTMSIDTSSKTISGTSFSHRLKTGGGGSQTNRSLKISVDSSLDFVIYACSSSGTDSRTMIVEVVENNAETVTIVRPTAVTLDKETATLTKTDDVPSPTVTLTATLTPDNVTSGHDKITWISSDTNVASVSGGVVTAKKAGTAVITAETENGHSASCTVTVANEMTAKAIFLADVPEGYASLGTSYVTTGTPAVVTTRAELVNAVANGGIIVIDGMIDMSEGKLPAAGKTMLDSTTDLDKFVTDRYSKYADYNAFVTAYAASCNLLTEDDSAYDASKDPFKTNPEVQNSSLRSELVALNSAYGNLIKLNLVSNTTIIGKNENSGIRGGSIQINGKSNIIIRNLTIQDPCDPFPHHEVNSSASGSDGYNAQWDGINIQGTSSNIWIDHCTFEDTLKLGYAKTNNSTNEKWQTYDGLCDMKNDSTNITVSNCHFKNHDKTMLIGSGDSDGDNTKRFVSLIGNYFENCGQRLPMVRNTKIHILNNYYVSSGSPYSSQSCVNARKNAIVYAENNYFDTGCQYSFNASSGDSTPVLYASGNGGSKAGSTSNITSSGTNLFSSLNIYSYTALSAAEAKTNAIENAGAGYVLK